MKTSSILLRKKLVSFDYNELDGVEYVRLCFTDDELIRFKAIKTLAKAPDVRHIETQGIIGKVLLLNANRVPIPSKKILFRHYCLLRVYANGVVLRIQNSNEPENYAEYEWL